MLPRPIDLIAIIILAWIMFLLILIIVDNWHSLVASRKENRDLPGKEE